MSDVSYLKGACVRDRTGESGRLEAVQSTFVEISWDLPNTSAVRAERLERSDDRFRFAVEILTMDKGWVPLGDVLPGAQDLSGIVAEVRQILDEGDHNPFQNKQRLGPGPRGSTMSRKQRWSCSGSGYSYTCVGIASENRGRVLHINIDPDYKRRYNADYKRFIRNRNRRRNRR